VNLVDLRIDQIQMDGGTQPRALLDWDAVHDYCDAMAAGAKFPPVTVFYDGERYWLGDGFHRVKAAYAAEFETIECDVHQGTLEDAQWFSFSANRTNGLRRTNDDKQRAVRAAITHTKAAELSNRQIAAHVGVDESTVRAWREKLTAEFPQSKRRRGRDGRTINTSKIGKTKRAQPEAAAADIATEAPADVPAVPTPAAVTEEAEEIPCRVEWSWCQRLHLASTEFTTCPVSTKDLATAIRKNDSSDQLKTQLEKTRDFINAILADAGTD
jgi:hypothetical protein